MNITNQDNEADDQLGSLNSPLLMNKDSQVLTQSDGSIQHNIRRAVIYDCSQCIPAPVSVTVSQKLGSRPFTVLNYGSQKIDDIPEPDSYDVQNIPASPTAFISQNDVVSPQVLHETINLQEDHSEKIINFLSDANVGDIDKAVVNNDYSQDYIITYKDEKATEINDTPKVKKHLIINIPPNLQSDFIKEQPQTYHSYDKAQLPFIDIISRGRIFSKAKKKRLVNKDGDVNVCYSNVKRKNLKFFQDTFTTLIDFRWRYLAVLFVFAFLVTWLGFALIWWLIAVRDSWYLLKTGNSTSESNNESQCCLSGVYNFPSAVLFSVETQHTIGYGTRSVTPDCPFAIIIVMIQSLIGVILACLTTGLIFAKFSKPKYRSETILFSKVAVICERNGRRCLMFRVGDMRQTHMISVNINAILVKSWQKTIENEHVPYMPYNLHLQSESEDFFFLAWPLIAIHFIDEHSPLWDLSEIKLLKEDFEIVVVFEGTNPSTCQTTQVKTSYLPSEILWGHHLKPLLTKYHRSGHIEVDYTQFHRTYNAAISSASAKEQFEKNNAQAQ